MARQLVFANGHMHVGLNEFGLVADLYFPHVGLESHIAPGGLSHKVGVFVDDKISWLDDGNWKTHLSYHDQTMVGDTIATNDDIGLRVEFTDAVDFSTNTWVRNIHIVNLRDVERNVKLFCHQAFSIAGSNTADSAQYRPDLPAIMHYKGRRFFMASLRSRDEYFDDFSIGKFDMSTGAGTYRDADDGHLSKNLVENGRVDSVIGLEIKLEPNGSVRAEYCLVAAQNIEDTELVLEKFFETGASDYLTRTANHWREWLSRAATPSSLPDDTRLVLNTSLLVIKAHIDAGGAVMASLDSSLKNHPQDDAYNFCWGRDAAFVLWPLIRLGYNDEFLSFMEFTKRTIDDEGYLHHKYRADGSLGSTWLPYVHPDGEVHTPIQVDETALVLFLAGQYFRQTGDRKMLADYYSSVFEPMANFLAGYVDEDGMPLPSYDPWEHDYLTHTYTTAVTSAALVEAAEMADAFARENNKQHWSQAAETMRRQSDVFYNPSRKYFYRGYIGRGEDRKFDETIDILSLYGAFMFGLVDTKSERIKEAIETARATLSDGRGYSRFENDDYYMENSQPSLWLNVSLWMAQIFLELDDISEAEKIIDFVKSTASPSGMMPEQVKRSSLEAASLSPLVWSHAELVNTLVDYWQTEEAK